jgi:hypothetical protein
MALSVEWSELLPWAGTFLGAAAVSSLWLVRYRKEKREFKAAEDFLRNGQYIDCLRHLSKADESWDFNAANSKPKTVVRDIDRLIAIVEMIGDAAARSGASVETKELLFALREDRTLYSDKAHYKFGSFTLKGEFAVRAEQLAREIGQHRSRLRASYSHLLH